MDFEQRFNRASTNLNDISPIQAIDAVNSEDSALQANKTLFVCPTVTHISHDIRQVSNQVRHVFESHAAAKRKTIK